jgi:hypothetical protein
VLAIRFQQIKAQLNGTVEHERDFLTLLLLATDRSLPEKVRGFLAELTDIFRSALSDGQCLRHALTKLEALCDVIDKAFSISDNANLSHPDQIGPFFIRLSGYLVEAAASDFTGLTMRNKNTRRGYVIPKIRFFWERLFLYWSLPTCPCRRQTVLLSSTEKLRKHSLTTQVY